MREAGGGQIQDKPSPLPAPPAGSRARWQSLLDPTLPTLQALGSWAMGRCAPEGRRLRTRSQLRDKPASLTFTSKGWLSIYPAPEVVTGALEAVNFTGMTSAPRDPHSRREAAIEKTEPQRAGV